MDYILTLFEGLSALSICKGYLNRKNSITLPEIFVLILDILIANLLFSDSTLALFILGQILIFFICLINTNAIKDTFYLAALTFITLVSIQVIASIPVALCSQIIKNTSIIEFLGNLITLIFIFIIMKTPIKRLFINIISTSFAYKISLISSYLYIATILVICQYDIYYLYSNVVLFVVVIMILIVSNLILLYYEKVISIKNQNIAFYKKHLPIYENLVNDIRANQHEFSNRMQALQILCESASLDVPFANKLREYANTYSKPFHAYPLLAVNKPLFAASLYSLYLKGESSGISIVFNVSSNELKCSVSEVILTDLSSILLQNAIEASKLGDNIYVSIGSTNNTTTVEIRNKVDIQITDSEISEFFTYRYSSKNTDHSESNSHGFGLYYLKREIEKCKGELLATCIPFNDNYWMIFRITL